MEFCGIPTNITQGNLQNSVINLCDKICVHVEEGGIQACHRMYLKPRDNGVARTLVRFLGKKTSGDILRSKKKLKDLNYVDLGFSAERKIFANDNLCPYFKKVLGIAAHLKRDRLIASCWSFKGLVFIKTNMEDVPLQITHVNPLKSNFPDVEYIKVSRSLPVSLFVEFFFLHLYIPTG